MKTILKALLLCLCIACYPLNAQNIKSIEFAAPLYPSFAYGFNYHPQWYTQFKPGIGLAFGSWGTAAALNFSAEQRYYYNMPKRMEKEKRTDYKSADYISLKNAVHYTFFGDIKPHNHNEYIYAVTINWGMRRAIGKRCYIDGSIGYGAGYFEEGRGFAYSYSSSYPYYESDYGWYNVGSWEHMIELNLGFGITLGHKH